MINFVGGGLNRQPLNIKQPMLTNFNRVRAIAVSNFFFRKPHPNRIIRSAGNLFTDRQTHRQANEYSKNTTAPRFREFRGGVKNNALKESKDAKVIPHYTRWRIFDR